MAKSKLVNANKKNIDNFLAKEGESVEEARARLSAEQKARKEGLE